jgi:deoxyribodipyrimidine photo-lyase
VPELAACSDKEIHAPWLLSGERLQALKLRLGVDYPRPVVDHATQRGLALALYKNRANE